MIDMCNQVKLPETCKAVQPSLIAFVSDDKTTCVTLLPSTIPPEYFSLADSTKPLDGFNIKNRDSRFNVQIRCNKTAKTPTFELSDSLLTIQSADSCGLINEPAEFLNNHKYIVSLFFIAIGAVLMLVGGYKWELLVEIFGFMAGVVSVYAAIWLYAPYSEEPSSYIAISIIALVAGAILGFVCRKVVVLSYILLGFGTGFFISRYLLIILDYRGPDVG